MHVKNKRVILSILLDVFGPQFIVPLGQIVKNLKMRLNSNLFLLTFYLNILISSIIWFTQAKNMTFTFAYIFLHFFTNKNLIYKEISIYFYDLITHMVKLLILSMTTSAIILIMMLNRVPCRKCYETGYYGCNTGQYKYALFHFVV